jgi:hypothetical protein
MFTFARSRIGMSGLFAVVMLQLPCSAEPSNGVDAKAIGEVKSGQRKEARAAWWGFDSADATAALQAAIDSGAEKVVLENLGSPWNVRPIRLADNQELILEKGVVLQAKRDAFRNKNDALLSASGKHDIGITGRGATLKMWKQDYVKPPYEPFDLKTAARLETPTGCDSY